MDDINLRAAARQSWDNVFSLAYPKLKGMINSIIEETERTLEDSKRELRTVTLALENFEQKLVTAKNSISSLIRSQENINSYLERVVGGLGEGVSSSDVTAIPTDLLRGSKGRFKYDEKTKRWTDEKGRPISEEEVRARGLNEGDKLKAGKAGQVVEAATKEGFVSSTVKTLNRANLVAAVAAAGILVYDIYKLDSSSPDYKSNVQKLVAKFIAQYALGVGVAALVGTVTTMGFTAAGAPIIAPLAGIVAGITAGTIAVFYTDKDVEKLTDLVIDKLNEGSTATAQSSQGGSPIGGIGGVAGGDLSALSSADSIRFVADRIIFNSLKITGGGQESSVEPAPSGAGVTGQRFPVGNQGEVSRGGPAGFSGAPGMASGGQRAIDTSGFGGGQSFLVPGRNSRVAASNQRFDASQVGGSGISPNISQAEYYNKMYGAVYEAAVARGLPYPEVVASLGASQTSLETGYGKHMVGNNAFGIKGTGSAGTVNANTQEFVGGRMVGMKQGFRAYGDVTESANDYVDMMLKNQKRYGGVLTAPTVEQAIAAQARSGYATDPAYGSKLSSINSKFASQGGNKPEPKIPSTGSTVNRASVENKVEKEKAQSSSASQVNNLITQSPSSQTVEQQPEQPRGKEVAVGDRLGRLISQS